MIIAIPLDENKKNVCVSFARAPFMLFCDTDANTHDTVPNPAAQADGGAGLKAAQWIIDHDANALITVRLGQNAANVLQAAEITIYKSEGEDALANAAALQEGKLSVLDHFHAGFHGIQ